MDINKIIIERSDKRRIHFIRYLKKPYWYFVKEFSDRSAYDFIVRSLHLPPHEDSGYMSLDIEWGFAVECKEVAADKFCNFLKEQVGKYVVDENDRINNWISGNGWYEFKDVTNTDKWLADYYTYQQENKTTTSSIQTMLF